MALKLVFNPFTGKFDYVVSSSGDVTKVGTPVDNQVGVWTGDGTIEGDANFTYDGSILTVNGATIDGMNIANDGTTTTFLGTVGDYNRIGDAGTTSHALASEDDLLVTGKLEVDGTAIHDGSAQFYGETTVYSTSGLGLRDNVPFKLGSSDDARLMWSTVQTVDTLMLGLDPVSNTLIIGEKNDITFNRALSAQTNPTVFGFSANQSTDEFWSITHDQTDTRIKSGTGTVTIGSGTKSRAVGADSLYVTNELEVDGITYFDAAVRCYAELLIFSNSGISVRDNYPLKFGTSDDAQFRFGTTQTNDMMMLALDDATNSMVITQLADVDFDFAHPAQTNPTLFGHSANQSTTEWWSLTHDQTDAVLDTGTGVLQIPDGSKMATSAAPTADAELANKKYVDDNAGGDLVVMALPIDDTDSNVTLGQNYQTPNLGFADAVSGAATFSVKVPNGATSISSIEVLYINTEPSTNLYLSFNTRYWAVGAAGVTDSESSATYATGSNDDYFEAITIPSTGYNAISSVAEDEVLTVLVTRTGGDASDTYNATWRVVGIRFTFA